MIVSFLVAGNMKFTNRAMMVGAIIVGSLCTTAGTDGVSLHACE